jgi:hypothetical protein
MSIKTRKNNKDKKAKKKELILIKTKERRKKERIKTKNIIKIKIILELNQRNKGCNRKGGQKIMIRFKIN